MKLPFKFLSKPNPPKNPESPPFTKQWIIDNVISLGTALLVVFVMRSSIIEPFKIPSSSMLPTLLVGDHIFVNKFSYGLKIPFSDLFTDHPIYIFNKKMPQHGDIIVFAYPKDVSTYYIKRIVGLPGDTIELRNKILYINQKIAKRQLVTGEKSDRLFQAIEDPAYGPNHLDVFDEHIDPIHHYLLLDKTNLSHDSYGPITVPADHLFVMGDNRDFSNDSRFWGFVPMKNVKGKAVIVWLSFWVNFSNAQFILRLNRTMTLIH